MTMTFELALNIIRVVAGLLLAGHGATKAFGAFGGPGIGAWTQKVAALGFRPARLWAYVSAYAELLGGIAFALGLWTPIAAAVLAVLMLTAIVKIHRTKGLWVTNGGYEYPLVLVVIATVIGLAPEMTYSVDRTTAYVAGPEAFATAFVVASLAAILGGFLPVPSRRRATA